MLGQALDGTTFQASDTEENRKEWPCASGPKPGCGFPVVGAMVAHSLVGKGSSVLVTAPWNAHDFRLYVEASGRFKAGELHVVKLELGVLVLAYNLLRYVIARGQAPGKRRGIASTAAAAMSFISTIAILCVARRSLAKAFTRLVAAVAADTLERRTRKNCVRAVKRRPKPYPLLTKPRSEYRPEEII